MRDAWASDTFDEERTLSLLPASSPSPASEPPPPSPAAMPPVGAGVMSNASARPHVDPHGNGVRIGEADTPAPSVGAGDDSDGDGAGADAQRKRRRRGARNWIAWERDSDDSSVTEADLMARAMAEASAGVAPSPAPAPTPTPVPAPVPTPAPAQPPAAHRAASEAGQVDPTPWPCLMKGCARPRRIRYRHGIGFPVGAFSWVCCLHCAYEAHDVDGVRVHTAECDALTELAPAPSAVHTADALTEPAPAPSAVPAVDPLSKGVAPSPAPAPTPTSVPAPVPTPAPAQPPAANRAASDADQVDPTPWPCLMKGCARPRRIRYRHGIGFPVGALSWVCCLHCAHEAHDVNGVRVHTAECDALTEPAPAPSAVHTADALTEPAPAPLAVPAVDLLFRRLAALERRDIEYALRRRGVAPLPALLPTAALAPAPTPALVPAPTPAPTPTPAEPQPPTPARAPSPAPATAPPPAPSLIATGASLGLPPTPASAPAPMPVPAPTPTPALAPAPTQTLPPTSTGAPSPAPGTAPPPAPSMIITGTTGRSSAIVPCSTPGCCRPRKSWRIDPATFFGVQICCELCVAAPPGAAATGGKRAHSRECNAAEATRQRQQPPATCATPGCGRPRRVWRVDTSTFSGAKSAARTAWRHRLGPPRRGVSAPTRGGATLLRRRGGGNSSQHSFRRRGVGGRSEVRRQEGAVRREGASFGESPPTAGWESADALAIFIEVSKTDQDRQGCTGTGHASGSDLCVVEAYKQLRRMRGSTWDSNGPRRS